MNFCHSIVYICNNYNGTGASTPYKRWSKCTMEKVGGGDVFFRNLGGSALIINALPLSFCKNAMINLSAN